MSDIFEIKGVDAELRVLDQKYVFADPIYSERMKWVKESMALEKTKPDDPALMPDFLELRNELDKKLMRMYLPSMPEDVINKMGFNAFTALMDKITELTGTKFGAKVEAKTEKKSGHATA